MKKSGQGRGKNRSPWRPLYWMPILSILLCMLGAKLILWGKLPETTVTLLPEIIGAVVGMLGAYRGARLAPRQGLLWGLCNGIGFGIILMIGNLFFFGETFESVGKMFLWILGGSCIGALLANFKKGKIA